MSTQVPEVNLTWVLINLFLTRIIIQQHLAKKIPYFHEKRKEECMEMLYQSKVPIQRALWYLKISQVGYSTVHDRNRTKKPLLEQYSIG
jgi:hypothetical protein